MKARSGTQCPEVNTEKSGRYGCVCISGFHPTINLLTQKTDMGLFILRCFYIVIAWGVGVYLLGMDTTPSPTIGLAALASLILLSGALVVVDMLIPRKRVIWISSIYFGLLVGTLLTAAIGYALMPLLTLINDEKVSVNFFNLMIILGISLCYLCTSFLIQTRDDFRFIIPYVEFRRDVKGNRPLILDTSVLIDGRIADVLETLVLDNQIVMPRFAVDELQHIADSADRSRRTRGRRGLDVLNRLQKLKGIDLHIDDTDLPEFRNHPVDLKLVELAKHVEGRLITNDYNLNKVAKVHNVDVINLNDLANALKPVFLPGEKLTVDLLKPGEETSQGIGYLDDGTMVVVEGGQPYVGERAVLMVTSVLQTSAGRMIFGRFESTVKRGESSPDPPLSLSSNDLPQKTKLGKVERNKRNGNG